MTPAAPELSYEEATREHQLAFLDWCRVDPVAFCEYVLKDEESGDPITVQPYQREWHELLTQHNRLVFWAAFELGKSQQISIGRVLWELGRNPKLRVVIVSNKAGVDGNATKISRLLRNYIQHSKELHEVFPNLLPSYPWTDHAFNVRGHSRDAKDFSVQATGVGGIQGARVDFLVLDDIVDFENSSTDHQQQTVINWVQSDLIGRMGDGGKMIAIGNVYKRTDVMHVLSRKPGYIHRAYPVQDEFGNSIWPEHWTPARIAQARDDLGPIEFLRKMMCKVRVDESAIFKPEWVMAAIARGAGRSLAYGLQAVPVGCSTHSGMDPAIALHKKSDLTAVSTILVHPNADRELLWVESGRWPGPFIVEKVKQTHHRFHSSVRVESNQAQMYLVQFVKDSSAVPVRAHNTGSNKTHPLYGLQGLADEFGSGKWIIPNEGGKLHPEVAALVNEMLTYDPTSHAGDRLMSLWLAREDARQGPQAVAEQGSLRLRQR